MGRLAVIKAIDAATVDTTATIRTDQLREISIAVVYTRVSGTGAGTLTFYGTLDSAATNTYKLGVKPMLTGTLDGDAAIDYTTSTTVGYTIDGVHPYIYLDWNETTNPASITVYIIGWEE